VFAVDEHRVLRRYRRGGDVASEAAVMAHVAAAGFPVPVVYEAHGRDLVMERIHGPTMLQALLTGQLAIEDAAMRLADLHHRLHAVPARAGTVAGHRVLHLDLHPDNVMLGRHGPVVIDWRNATDGPPDLDLAMTAVILAQVAVHDSHELAPAAADLLSAFLRFAEGDLASRLGDAVAVRRADPALTAAEADRLPEAARLITQDH
jgi:aminoglycoside phosphotransferase (APT) family kinase protein